MLNLYNYYITSGLFSRIIWVSQLQKGKPFWILMKQEMMNHMQIICTSLQSLNI